MNNPAKNFVMVTSQFGYDLFVMPVGLNGQIEVTDVAADAELFTIEDTLSAAKLPYYEAVTGYTGLTFKQI